MKSGKNGLYEDLKRQILTMELRPDQVMDEVALSERYGLSRTPVREIFRRLAGEGYLDIREHRGARVIPMDYSTLRNFFLVAPMVYAAIGRLAVQNFSGAQLNDLKRTQERFRKATVSGEPMSMVLENNRFHEIMGEMAGNPYLEPSLRRLLIDHSRISHAFFRPRESDLQQRLDLAVQHHDAFIEAIGQRDEERVVELVFEHWELSRANMQLFITPPGIEADARVEGV